MVAHLFRLVTRGRQGRSVARCAAHRAALWWEVHFRRGMPQLLTVRQARQLSGKSESTIKRMVREIVADPNHPDRRGVHPNDEELQRLRAAGEPYVWRIDRELLLRRFPLKEEETPSGEAAAAGGRPPGDAVMGVLQEQLHSKDEQIRTLEKQLDRKDEQIANLGERQRETNVLMRELQQRLALAPPSASAAPDGEAPARASQNVQRPPKKGRLRRLLGLRIF